MNLSSPKLTDITLQDRYQIKSQLSKKYGRRTLLALDLHTQQLVIVKLLIFNAEFDWDDLKLFEREAETLKSIEHPAIPRYLDSFDLYLPNCQGFALVQSYIEAPSLAQVYQDGRRFTNTDVRQLAHSLLNILIYLHDYTPSIIHRDIKPSNILIANRTAHNIGDIYLVDFGAVQGNLGQDGSTITIVGTYGYMPPEQFGGRTNPASDLYSLGATLIYLVTGIHPAELSTKDGKIQFDLTADLDLKKWLDLMTEPSLDRRVRTASIAKIELDRVQSQIQAVPTLTIKSRSDKPEFLPLKFPDAFDSRLFMFFGTCGVVLGSLSLLASIVPHLSIGFHLVWIIVFAVSEVGLAILFTIGGLCYLCFGTICYYPIAILWNILILGIYSICKISKAILRLSD